MLIYIFVVFFSLDTVPNFKFELVNESLIVKTLQGLKASKASGLDNISPRMLKDAAVVVAKPLT